ncbi:predicted protein [Chaetoceros tenuissimus]|uniref:Uncharacterized protein n=1 Tax=Chaetoceros tenuissimus TaxID=426638 RepID=A0AAD3D3R8_9STRA|nr:predicted protein [Chaetoceros tenuissimus]
MTPATKLALQRAGYSSTLITSLGDKLTLETGTTSMHLPFDVVNVSALLFHHWKQSSTQDILKSNVEAMVLEIGWYGDITAQRISLQYCSTNSWMLYTLNFMQEHGIMAQVPHVQLIPSRRGDISIIQAAFTIG